MFSRFSLMTCFLASLMFHVGQSYHFRLSKPSPMNVRDSVVHRDRMQFSSNPNENRAGRNLLKRRTGLGRGLLLHMSVVERGKVARPQSSALPKHPDLVEGRLENGFTYLILPNSNPAGRFEAHLEVLSGSAKELERQQGMAHLLEHVAYMGSPKRQAISGTGSRTNAYTDFHHTVFFASCPTQTPDGFFKKPMLPMAFDALLDVMTTRVDDDRMEKERAAVLSEASMVNKMEYRVECQVLSALHNENRISVRFPIGKIDLIKSWEKEELQLYHSIHYRPDNVILYVVGDVDVNYTIETIKQKFGSLKPKLDASKLLKESGEFPPNSMTEVYRHFPPVVHRWSCSEEVTAPLIPPALLKPTTLNLPGIRDEERAEEIVLDGALPQPRVFKHDLLQSFSFHLFAKRPIEPVTTTAYLKRDIMRKIALSALQIRFNVLNRDDALCTFVDFNQLNWPREGCSVCSLDLTADVGNWRSAVKTAVMEIRRLGLYGLTDNELLRYKTSVLAEAEQYAAQSDQMGNEDVLAALMESESCGHVFMHPSERLDATINALNDITVEDMNQMAMELCEHLSHIQPENGVRPAAVIACVPVLDRNGKSLQISDDEVTEVIKEALLEPLDPLEETLVPSTLIAKEDLSRKAAITMPHWVPLTGKAAATPKNDIGIDLRRLNNGVKVNMISMRGEPQRVAVRMYVPGGRMRESKGEGAGAVLIGSRTMQEGGAFLDVSREEVELFCIDHNVMIEIIATDDALVFDCQSVTSTGPGGEVTGLEAIMQVLHIILTDFKFEKDAFQRATEGSRESYDTVVKSLESACLEAIVRSVTGDDLRFCSPDHSIIDKLDLPTVEDAIKKQLDPSQIEVTMSGDVPIETLQDLALAYLGTVPAKENTSTTLPEESLQAKLKGKDQLWVYIPDSDERAMGYLSGSAPNLWGVFADGTTVMDMMAKASGGNKKDIERRSHPLFGHALLQVLQEVANKRLFSIVREERRLTYDASFQLMGRDIIKGGWYLVSVTSSPSQVQAAVEACKDAMRSLKGPFGVMNDSVQSAKRSLLQRFNGASSTNRFWMDYLSGSQVDAIPFKSVKSITDYESVVSGITAGDIQLLLDSMSFNDESLTACVGVTAPNKPTGMK